MHTYFQNQNMCILHQKYVIPAVSKLRSWWWMRKKLHHSTIELSSLTAIFVLRHAKNTDQKWLTKGPVDIKIKTLVKHVLAAALTTGELKWLKVGTRNQTVLYCTTDVWATTHDGSSLATAAIWHYVLQMPCMVVEIIALKALLLGIVAHSRKNNGLKTMSWAAWGFRTGRNCWTGQPLDWTHQLKQRKFANSGGPFHYFNS